MSRFSRFFEDRGRGRRSGFETLTSIVGDLLTVGQQVEGFRTRRKLGQERETDRARAEGDRVRNYERQDKLDTAAESERQRRAALEAEDQRAQRQTEDINRRELGYVPVREAADERGRKVELQARVGHNLSSIRELGNDLEFNRYTSGDQDRYVKAGRSRAEQKEYDTQVRDEQEYDLAFRGLREAGVPESQARTLSRDPVGARSWLNRPKESPKTPWEKDGFKDEKSYLDFKRRETGATQRTPTSDPVATSQRSAIKQAIQSATQAYTRGQSDGLGGFTGRLSPAEAARQARADAIEVHGEEAVREAVGGVRPQTPASPSAAPQRGAGGRGGEAGERGTPQPDVLSAAKDAIARIRASDLPDDEKSRRIAEVNRRLAAQRK